MNVHQTRFSEVGQEENYNEVSVTHGVDAMSITPTITPTPLPTQQLPPPTTPYRREPLHNCAKCGRQAPASAMQGNPCCTHRLWCSNYFLEQYRTYRNGKMLLNMLVYCTGCRKHCPNPLLMSDIEIMALLTGGLQ